MDESMNQIGLYLFMSTKDKYNKWFSVKELSNLTGLNIKSVSVFTQRLSKSKLLDKKVVTSSSTNRRIHYEYKYVLQKRI